LVSAFLADEAAADIGPVRINGAAAVREELAAVLNEQQVSAREGEVETGGPEGVEPFILGPGDRYAGKGAAAGAIAGLAGQGVTGGPVQQEAVPFDL